MFGENASIDFMDSLRFTSPSLTHSHITFWGMLINL